MKVLNVFASQTAATSRSWSMTNLWFHGSKSASLTRPLSSPDWPWSASKASRTTSDSAKSTHTFTWNAKARQPSLQRWKTPWTRRGTSARRFTVATLQNRSKSRSGTTTSVLDSFLGQTFLLAPAKSDPDDMTPTLETLTLVGRKSRRVETVPGEIKIQVETYEDLLKIWYFLYAF